ncbi:hypothetical protein A3A95_02995 [Candidatus Nomurabacteria bacterium RIFCSPLOWO2_01_FULL_39_18]|uniref:RelA/SpoT domain-containing protein n=1 Tax=Candidatus Nomurabacteria bacterium RIFCSPHIGHO2_01_FULL_40_24b TaxID=1801739 RepID=A0A1F6V7C4_9BACT|nr:MAG: hypothetical protein A2647_03570 [Candidatus Nomurabacteria bacterium RIFCSPHIGHO2_01_FULL_40_24b]OGI89625.1 MAG: hypothetical protein A3A95_02995 [Candidatus Nomurabacteria bacterium RIFCSPLOWO2_01_FULL_39_18]
MPMGIIENIISMFNQRHKDEKVYLDTILTDYKNKRPSYEEFRVAAHKTLEALLEESGYKYQIFSRTKVPERLEEKLIRKRAEGVYYYAVEDIEDLVGIRVVFYTERDKEKFIKKIKNEIGGFLKVKERDKQNGYKATHVIMSFGRKRLKLSEYKHFRGLKSEIQITSILHHAWAEIEHDLIYKDINNLKIQNPGKFALMKQKMNGLMEKYIKKAATELEEIIDESIS